MKFSAAICLVAICISLIAPISITIPTSNGEHTLVTLDVCHAGSAALSTSADVSVIQESSHQIMLPLFSGYANMFNIVFLLPIVISTQDRPPKA